MRASTWALALLSLAVGLDPAAADEQEFYLSPTGRRIPVEIDEGTVAVTGRAQPPPSPLERLGFGDTTEGIETRMPELDLSDEASASLNEGATVVVPLSKGADVDETVGKLRTDESVESAGAVVRVGPSAERMSLRDEIVAKPRKGAPRDELDRLLDTLELQAIRKDGPSAMAVLQAPGAGPSQLLEKTRRLQESGLFEYAVPNFAPLEAQRSKGDPLLETQWHLRGAREGGAAIEPAWRITTGDPNVVIAIIDDGFDLDHSELAVGVRGKTRDFSKGDEDDYDPRPDGSGDIHGTPVAGLAIARRDNELGGAGVCPRCGFLPIRISTDGGNLYEHARAIRHAADSDAAVILASWGYSVAGGGPLVDAINYAAKNGRRGKGAVLVFAASNLNVDQCETEDVSALDSVIGVSTVSSVGDRQGPAGYGSCLDLVAPTKAFPSDAPAALPLTTTDVRGPGGWNRSVSRRSLYSSWCGQREAEEDNFTRCFGGTSAAAPIVAGSAGLLLAVNGNLTRDEVYDLLTLTADRVDPTARYRFDGRFGYKSDRYGYGRVNAWRAITPTARLRVRKSAQGKVRAEIVATAPHRVARIILSAVDSNGRVLVQKKHTPSKPRVVEHVAWEFRVPTEGDIRFVADTWDTSAGLVAKTAYPHRASEAGGAAEVVLRWEPKS